MATPQDHPRTTMVGVVAAGSVPTATAGAEILARGGNAADAAIGACFATGAGEPSLTSLAGGGVMVYRDGQSGKVTLCDFFSDAPKRRLDPSDQSLDFFGVDLNFGPTTQEFHIGAASAAIPSVIPGLGTALDQFGSLPLGEIVAPACRMLREGFVFGAYQEFAAKLLEPILTYSPMGKRVWHVDGHMIQEGDRFRLPMLADTLERMAKMGWRRFLTDEFHPQIASQFGPENGGLLELAELNNYQPVLQEPLKFRFADHDLYAPPAPAVGGTMVAFMLALLEATGEGELLSQSRTRLLCNAMALADEARVSGGLVAALSDPSPWAERLRVAEANALLFTPRSAGGSHSTTHISVVDKDGNGAAITFSYGEGNGHFIGETGIMMNNLMGEADLFPSGFGSAPPGQRLPTMMTPTIAVRDDGEVTVLGTGGANRIRTALVQVLSLSCRHDLPAAEAVAFPRVHFEQGVLNAEIVGPESQQRLEGLEPDELVTFDGRSMFFGGVHLVKRRHDGTCDAAGDPRRGGAVAHGQKRPTIVA